jgi:hypothetical protein
MVEAVAEAGQYAETVLAMEQNLVAHVLLIVARVRWALFGQEPLLFLLAHLRVRM